MAKKWKILGKTNIDLFLIHEPKLIHLNQWTNHYEVQVLLDNTKNSY